MTYNAVRSRIGTHGKELYHIAAGPPARSPRKINDLVEIR
jgi:hypothetical protein